MSVLIENRLTELAPYIQELSDLSSLPNPTRQQNTRINSLMAIVSAIKSGVTASEVRTWEMEELRKAAGLARLPERTSGSRLGDQLENDWRKWALTGECRETQIPLERERRANEAGTQSLTWTTGTAGGYFVPQGFADRFWALAKTYDEIFNPEFSNVFFTDSGSAMNFPWVDDTTNSSVIVGETAQSNEVDVAAFGGELLSSFSFRSKIIAVSLELLQDFAFPIGGLLEQIITARHSRGVGQYYATGPGGTSGPTGLVTAIVNSGVVPTIASGSSTNDGSASTGANSIGSGDINKLYHSLSKIYRNKACFFGTDNTLRSLEGQLTKDGLPLVSYRRGLTDVDGETPYLYGRRFAVCPSMPEISSGSNPLVFGNPDYFITRRVKSSQFVRRFYQQATLVQFGLVGFEGWMRTDSNAIIANVNQSPFQFIQAHS